MVILYSTNCPRCRIIEKKLQDKGIEFELFNDVDAMIALLRQKSTHFIDDILSWEK